MIHKPYLSIVVATRNDNHGGDLDRRTQIFIDALAAQVQRHRVAAELIVVEWNPPPARPPLAQAFRWPADNEWLEVRIVTVPAAIHARYRDSEKLPLYQMIAKNVGVRRARGEFILETNIDVLFSDAIFQLLAGKLKKGVLYRSNRIDVDRGVPLGAPVSVQLEYCRTHVLRVSRKDGVWLIPEHSPQRTVEEATLHEQEFRARQETPGARSLHRNKPRVQPRIGVVHLAVRRALGHGADASQGAYTTAGSSIRVLGLLAVVCASTLMYLAQLLLYLAQLPLHLARMPIIRLFTQTVPGIRRYLRKLGYKPTLVELLDYLTQPNRVIPPLHTNACGDFILTDRDTWFAMRASPELEMYSLHIDGLTLINAYRAGVHMVELPSDHVHYHIEHGGGWTPEQADELHRKLNARGIRVMLYATYLRLACHLLEDPQYQLSPSDWGLAQDTLPEHTATARTSSSRPAAVAGAS